MQTMTTSRFIGSSSKTVVGLALNAYFAALYQSTAAVPSFIRAAEHCFSVRDFDGLRLIVPALNAFSASRGVAEFFQAQVHLSSGEVEQATYLLERASVTAPPPYRAMALIHTGKVAALKRDAQTQVSCYRDATKVTDPHSLLDAHRHLAIVAAQNGDHRGSLDLLESLFSLAHVYRGIHPHLYYDYLNSFAVELGEVGRVQEARNVISIVLASPYAFAYPEWRATRDELALRGRKPSRDFVAVDSLGEHDNVVYPNFGVCGSSVGTPAGPSPVADLLEWREAMTKPKQEEPKPKQLTEMSLEEKREELMKLIAADRDDTVLDAVNSVGTPRVDKLKKAFVVACDVEEAKVNELLQRFWPK